MGVFDGGLIGAIRERIGMPNPSRSVSVTAETDFSRMLERTIQNGGEMGLHAQVVKDRLDLATAQASRPLLPGAGQLNLGGSGRELSSIGGLVGINDYGVKGRRQYAAERRRLLDLYVIVLNNGDIRTAVTHLRNEIFRRGLEWEPAFEFKCPECDTEYTAQEAKQLKYYCPEEIEEPEPDALGREPKVNKNGQSPKRSKGTKLRKPDPDETAKFDTFLEKCNYFGQSLESILRMGEDDLNTVDDAFIYFRTRYTLPEEKIKEAREDPFNDEFAPSTEVMQVFRLDPTLVEFDLDARGVPGQLHHICVFHRQELLNVPIDEGWDLQWKGRCLQCGLRTYPVYYKYSEQQSGSFGAHKPDILYLLDDEVVHHSRYSPTETYGFPPVLSIYEKALTLIGMDRYLYDYFYERRVPQGVITVSTDDVVGFEATRADLEAKIQRDPHYIPMIAIGSKSGQGKMEFVRFAYSLDELDYLPVRDEIRERIAGLYGVSQIWMQDSEGVGGLNSETQQLTVMSRVVEGAQRTYHTEVFPKLERALGVTEWHLRIKTPEETNELAELQLFQSKIANAQMMAGMGFGVEFDSETETFTFNGSVKSAEDQQQAQMQGASPFSGAGAGGAPPPGGAAPPPDMAGPPPGGAQPSPGGAPAPGSVVGVGTGGAPAVPGAASPSGAPAQQQAPVVGAPAAPPPQQAPQMPKMPEMPKPPGTEGLPGMSAARNGQGAAPTPQLPQPVTPKKPQIPQPKRPSAYAGRR